MPAMVLASLVAATLLLQPTRNRRTREVNLRFEIITEAKAHELR